MDQVSLTCPPANLPEADHGIRDVGNQPMAFAGSAWNVTVAPSLSDPTIRLNEIVAANATGLVDEDGEPQPWIEIQNFGSEPVRLAQFSLSDARDQPGEWVFPDTTLGAGRSTPSAANTGITLSSACEPVAFSGSFELILSTPTPGAAIRYTLNGAEPNATNSHGGFTSVATTARGGFGVHLSRCPPSRSSTPSSVAPDPTT